MPSAGYTKKKNKKRPILRLFLSLLSLVILTVIAVSLIKGGGKLDLSGLKTLVGADRSAVSAFYFDDGKSGAFADLDGAFAAVGPLGVQVFDNSGNEVAKETVAIKDPTMCSEGGSAAAYDLGGTTLMLLDKSGIKAKITASDSIISASVNADGWCAVCSQESGYKGLVVVYDASGNPVYKWHSGSGYVLSADVTDDNKSLAVLTLTGSGSRVVFFDLDSTDEKASYTQDGELLLEVKFWSDGTLAAIGKDGLYHVDQSGKELSPFDYSGQFLNHYDLDGNDFSVLCVDDYQVGGQGTIETVGKDGKVISSVDGECTSVSAGGDYVAVLQQDSLTIYDKSLKILKSYQGISGASGVLMRSDGEALVTGEGSAVVYSSK